jgi:hypothetical protein
MSPCLYCFLRTRPHRSTLAAPFRMPASQHVWNAVSHVRFYFSDGAGARAPYDYGAYSAPPDTPVPPRDEKVHDSLISDRVNRERPCRTLFIRNIKASALPYLCRQQEG